MKSVERPVAEHDIILRGLDRPSVPDGPRNNVATDCARKSKDTGC